MGRREDPEEKARQAWEREERRRREAAAAQQRWWQSQSNTCQTSVGACWTQGTLRVGAQRTCTWVNAFGQWITYSGVYIRDR